jgi:hypothetical protein
MKALILPFVIAIVIGVGAASAASVMKAKHAALPVVADSTKQHAAQDSGGLRVIEASGATVAAAPAAAHDSANSAASAPATPADTTKIAHQVAPATPRATTGAAKPVDVTSAQANVAAPAAARAPVSAGAAVAVPAAQKRIARVFASMAPRDAAKVLEQMNDADVSIILGNLTEKQTGAIMALLPAPRVAALSRGALRSSPGAH